MKYLKNNIVGTILVLLLLVVTFSVAAMAETQANGIGTVTASSLRLRSEPSTSSKILTNLSKNTLLAVVNSSDGWYQVQYDGKDGFVSSDYVDYISASDSLNAVARVVGSSVYIRSEANTSSAKVATVLKNAIVTVKGFKDGWYAVEYSGKSGYIRSDLLAITSASKSGSSIPASTAISSDGKTYTLNGATVADIITYAKSFLGTPYRYGGTSSNGFDCSGFTYYVFKHFGISLPHSATSQLSFGIPVDDRSDLKVGDLVFFRDTHYSTKAASHVGIYIGDSQFIHASSSVSGKYVRVNSLNESYHSSVYTVGRRLVAE